MQRRRRRRRRRVSRDLENPHPSGVVCSDVTEHPAAGRGLASTPAQYYYSTTIVLPRRMRRGRRWWRVQEDGAA